jgi:hypothetical protein
MRTDPVGQRLGPARLSVGEVGGAHDRDENLRRTDLAGEPIDDHRHRVAGVIDKQLVAADPKPRLAGRDSANSARKALILLLF